ncbi:DedA family protein [Patescibacteria group bacterium]
MEFLAEIIEIFKDMGYIGILILMILEASLVPLSSKLIIVPAAYLAFKGEMNIFVVLFIAVLGAVIGASINYFIARRLGPAVCENKYIKKIVTKKKMDKTKKFFDKYGNFAVFWGSMMPGIRQFIPFPAGFVKMRLSSFLISMLLGAIIWISVLLCLVYLFTDNYELIVANFQNFLIFALGLLFFSISGVFVKRALTS